METITQPKRTAEIIARENDLFRARVPGIIGKILFTENVSELMASLGNPMEMREQLLQAVGGFSGFSNANNPYGERDFGRVECFGNSFFFKIDYGHPIDGTFQDPYEMVPYRIMTIMLPEDY